MKCLGKERGPGKEEVRKGAALTERKGDQTQGPQVRRDTRKETDPEVRRAAGDREEKPGRASLGRGARIQPQGSTPSPPGKRQIGGSGRHRPLSAPTS